MNLYNVGWAGVEAVENFESMRAYDRWASCDEFNDADRAGNSRFKNRIDLPEVMWQVGGYFAMNLTMPTVLGWVLGGNTSNLSRSARVPFCRVGDKPKAFCESVRVF